MSTEQEAPKQVFIEAINRARRHALDNHNRLWPFVGYLDALFEDCEEEEAEHVMIGSETLGYTIVALNDYEFQKPN